MEEFYLKIYLFRANRVPPIKIARNSQLKITIETMDYTIPEGATASAFAKGAFSDKVYTQSCTVDGNRVSFTPEPGFFVQGRNILQYEIGDSVIPLAIDVNCELSLPDGGESVEPDTVKPYVLRAEAAAEKSEEAAARAEEVKDSIPKDYTELSDGVNQLKDDLGNYSYTKTEGMYVNGLGEIKPYEGAYDIYTIDVSLFNGRTIRGHSTGYKNYTFGVFYKKDGSVISVVTNDGSDMDWEYNFMIPNRADKFVIDYRTSGSGDFTVTIDNLTQSFIDFAKWTKGNNDCVTVGINGDYPSIIQALKGTSDKVKVKVLDGTYDLANEYKEYYGDDFFVNYDGYDAHPDDHFYKGMWINNGRVIEFDSKAKVIFNYNGENDSVKSQFSAFSMGYNATIRGINLVYSGCRYAIHDDFARINAEYHSGRNVIENCTFDGNPYFPAVIGGGFGDDNEYIIRNCLFLNNNQNNDVTYHNTYYENAKSKLIIENCYGNKDCKMFWYGLSELISDCIVTNSKFNSISCVAHSYEPNEYENIRLFAWNNTTTN